MAFDFVYTYTRKQAIEDGVLIDITDTTNEMGFSFPIAITRAVWNGYIVPDKKLKQQSSKSRLYDVISSLYFSIYHSPATRDLLFKTVFMMADKQLNYIYKTIRLKAISSAGDKGEPVITIMLPEEN